jgi:hypothetical protein
VPPGRARVLVPHDHQDDLDDGTEHGRAWR